MKNFVSVFLCAALACTSCSHFSKSARQQRAYEKYVRKACAGRHRMAAKMHRGKTAMPPMTELPPSEPATTTSIGPESISSASEGGSF